jgi:hypothetical protein
LEQQNILLSLIIGGERLEKIHERKLPLIYRLILKLPMPSLDFLPDVFQGIYWAIIIPIFLMLEFWFVWILVAIFPSPFNILAVLTIPAIILIVFLRITLERFINWWNAIVAQQDFRWNVEKFIEDYLEFLKRQKSKKKES